MIDLITEVSSAPPLTNPAQLESTRLDLAKFPRTDAGNAQLFAHLFAPIVRFDHLRCHWLLWDATRKRWSVDYNGQVRWLAIQSARRRLSAAQQLAIPPDRRDDTRQQNETKWAVKSENFRMIDATLELAKSISPISDSGEGWDADPLLLGVANGVVDLRTGKLRDERPCDKILKHSPVLFDQCATCPVFEKFLADIFPDHPELPAYIQKVMGYCLTGEISEHRIFNNYGLGANGKGTITETIRHILGEYAVNIPFSALEASHFGNSSTHELVSLRGARFATSSETSDGARFNEARIKMLSGGDPITARALYQNFSTFPPTHKLWLSFNHKPIVADDTHGFWRRMDLIPYTRIFDNADRDDSLLEKLKAEASGILALAVRGCLLWQEEGLAQPACVSSAVDEYRQETDVLAEFVNECCVLGEDQSVTTGTLWIRYKRWADDNGETCLAKLSLLDRLVKQYGIRKERFGHTGTRGWRGLGVAPLC
jgi:putative DNA primase/helicase